MNLAWKFSYNKIQLLSLLVLLVLRTIDPLHPKYCSNHWENEWDKKCIYADEKVSVEALHSILNENS